MSPLPSFTAVGLVSILAVVSVVVNPVVVSSFFDRRFAQSMTVLSLRDALQVSAIVGSTGTKGGRAAASGRAQVPSPSAATGAAEAAAAAAGSYARGYASGAPKGTHGGWGGGGGGDQGRGGDTGRANDPELRPLAFLFGVYRPGCYFWEAPEM